MRKKTGEIKLDDNQKYFYKTQGVMPHYIAYEKFKGTYILEGYVYVPKHFLINNSVHAILLIEGIKWNGRDAIKWYDYDGELQELVKTLSHLLNKIYMADFKMYQVNYKKEFEEIFDVFPQGVSTDWYRKNIANIAILNYNVKCKHFLLPRDLYNNILLGTPWGGH